MTIVLSGNEFCEMMGWPTDEDYDPYEWKEPPEIGQLAMGAVLFEILAVSMFGDEVFVKPLPSTCWIEEHKRWEPVYHLGTEPCLKKIEDLLPGARPNKAMQPTADAAGVGN